MEVTHTHCVGLDVHKKIVVVCILIQTTPRKLERNIRSFGTTTSELLALSDWLATHNVTQVSMENTRSQFTAFWNFILR